MSRGIRSRILHDLRPPQCLHRARSKTNSRLRNRILDFELTSLRSPFPRGPFWKHIIRARLNVPRGGGVPAKVPSAPES